MKAWLLRCIQPCKICCKVNLSPCTLHMQGTSARTNQFPCSFFMAEFLSRRERFNKLVSKGIWCKHLCINSRSAVVAKLKSRNFEEWVRLSGGEGSGKSSPLWSSWFRSISKARIGEIRFHVLFWRNFEQLSKHGHPGLYATSPLQSNCYHQHRNK